MSKRHLLWYETKHEPLLSRREFLQRLTRNFAVSAGLVGLSLLAGMAGYHFIEEMTWIDAFANASMILSGMGPLEPIRTTGGKLFAGCYALYSGLVLILATGFLLAPLLHRMLHRFHVEADEDR